jgi:hypothetical protein
MRGARAGLAACAVALVACGQVDTPTETKPIGVGEYRAGSYAPLAQCSDWNEGTEEEKLATVADIRAQLNQAGADGPTPSLPENEAFDLFERACANDYATGFRLYKVYARAAAFSSLAE